MDVLDQRVIGAQHEIAHALAYLFFGRMFRAIDVDADGVGAVSVDPTPIGPMDQSHIAAAGMAVELRYTQLFEGSVAEWFETLLAMVNEPDREPEDDDLYRTNGYLFVSLPWALAFNAAYWLEIEEGGEWLLATGGHLHYPAVASRFQRLFEPSLQRSIDMQAQLSFLAPFQDLIAAVDEAVNVAASSRF